MPFFRPNPRRDHRKHRSRPRQGLLGCLRSVCQSLASIMPQKSDDVVSAFGLSSGAPRLLGSTENTLPPCPLARLRTCTPSRGPRRRRSGHSRDVSPASPGLARGAPCSAGTASPAFGTGHHGRHRRNVDAAPPRHGRTKRALYPPLRPGGDACVPGGAQPRRPHFSDVVRGHTARARGRVWD